MRPRNGAAALRTALVSWVALWVLAAGCAGGPEVRGGAEVPAPPVPDEPVAAAGAPDADLEAALDATREALAAAWAEVADERLRVIGLERRVLELESAARVETERRNVLEAELAAAIDEVLRSKASLTGGSSRALAASRIAEARAAAAAIADAGAGAEGSQEQARVSDLLDRADLELAAANYPGAAYLAERASQLLRQARRESGAGGVPPPPPELVAPLVPAERMEATQPANLRVGPGLEYERLVVLEVGETLRAVARAGEWLQVERADGQRGWVHARLVAAAGR